MTLPCLAHGLRQRRYDLEDVADDPVIRDLEDRCFLILVDRDDRLRCAHASEVLDRARDPDRNVELWTHLPTSLPDLIGVRSPAFVGHGTRRTDGGVAECVGQLFDKPEILRSLESAS